MKKYSKIKLNEEEKGNKRKFVTIIIIALLIFIIFQRFDLNYIRGLIEGSGIFAPLTFILIKIIIVVLAPMTAFPIFLFAGPLFGYINGLIYIIIADIIGSSIAFLLSRKYGEKVIYSVIPIGKKGLVKKLLSSVGTWQSLVLTRLILPFQDIITYAAGLTKISFKSFIISSTLVKAISFALLVALGMALLDKTTLFIVGSILFTIALIIVLTRLLRKRYANHKLSYVPLY